MVNKDSLEIEFVPGSWAQAKTQGGSPILLDEKIDASWLFDFSLDITSSTHWTNPDEMLPEEVLSQLDNIRERLRSELQELSQSEWVPFEVLVNRFLVRIPDASEANKHQSNATDIKLPQMRENLLDLFRARVAQIWGNTKNTQET